MFEGFAPRQKGRHSTWLDVQDINSTVNVQYKGKQDENCVAQRLFEEETSE